MNLSRSLLLVSLWCLVGSLDGVCGQSVENARLLPMGGMRGTEVSIELPGKYEKLSLIHI